MKNPNYQRTHAGKEAYLRTQPAFSDLSARGLAMDLLDTIPDDDDLALLAVGRVSSHPAVLAVTDRRVMLSVPDGLRSSVHVFEQDAKDIKIDPTGYLNRVTLDPSGSVFLFDFRTERDWKVFRTLLSSLVADVEEDVEIVAEGRGVDAREREIRAVINQSSLPAEYEAPVKYAASRLKEGEIVIAAATATYHEPCVVVLTDQALRIVERHGHSHRLSLDIPYASIDRIDREKGKSLRIWQGRSQTLISAFDNPDMVRNVIERLRDAGTPDAEPPATPFASASPADDLKKLADLFAAGYLTEEEFTNAKKRIFLA